MAASITRLSRDDRRGDLLLVSALLADARARDLAPPRVPLRQEWRGALRTGLVDRPGPEGELAVRIVAAREERLAAARAPLDQLPAAARLGARDAERDGLGRLALRVAGAGDELAEPAMLDHHRLLAGRARLVGRLVGRLLP